MFPLAEIPTQIEWQGCVKELALEEGAEWLAARLLKGHLAPAGNAGYDIHQSALFPGLTFQIKVSRPGEGHKVQKIVNGRDSYWDESPTWTWGEYNKGEADIYILYGVNGEMVYPFVVPHSIWERQAFSNGNKGLVLRVSTEQYSRCGRHERATKRNKFWQYYIKSWPGGLFRRVTYYTKRQPCDQIPLVEIAVV